MLIQSPNRPASTMSVSTCSTWPMKPRNTQPINTASVAAVITNTKMVWMMGAQSVSPSPRVNRDMVVAIPMRSRIEARSTADSIRSTVP